jgi:cobalt-precorrin-5B (C1)-methyltransferase
MIDPVTGFEYPQAWVDLCRDPEGLDLARRGLAVLTSDGGVHRRGFTTGTAAAAACKAAIESLDLEELNEVDVTLACGLTCTVDVKAGRGKASCKKYSGDYPDDATAGIEFRAEFLGFKQEVVIDVGPGIGRLERDTPLFKKGDPAVSRTARKCMVDSIHKACLNRGEMGALVRVWAVDGEKVALKTLNHRMGVRNGVSVLGSTGLVEPWDDHLGQDAVERVRAAERAVVTTGRIGLKHARLRYPDREVVLVGARIKAALESRCEGLILFGLPALIINFIDEGILERSGYPTVGELMASEKGHEAMHASVLAFKERYPGHGIVFIDREGRVLEAAE